MTGASAASSNNNEAIQILQQNIEEMEKVDRSDSPLKPPSEESNKGLQMGPLSSATPDIQSEAKEIEEKGTEDSK